jgi:hypothetical protein
MTMFAVDPSKNTFSEEATRPVREGEYDVSSSNARILAFLSRRVALADEMLETLAYSQMSEETFAEEWDSPEDAIYNDLQ